MGKAFKRQPQFPLGHGYRLRNITEGPKQEPTPVFVDSRGRVYLKDKKTGQLRRARAEARVEARAEDAPSPVQNLNVDKDDNPRR
jgi:streptogramin lyase